MDLAEDFLSQCFSIGSISDLNDLFSRILKYNNIFRWVYVYFPDGENNRPLYYSSDPEEWLLDYFENQFQNIDPTLRDYTHTQGPYLWSDFLKKDECSLAQKRFFKEIRDFRLDEGIAVPIFPRGKTISAALLILIPEKNYADYYKGFVGNEMGCKILAHTYHALVQQFHLTQPRQDYNPLSPREQECLSWVAKGKTDYEIALILGGLAKPTVTNIINSAKEKLDCYSRTSATIKAIRNHYIPLYAD
jgi:LuxR family quorum-sensing system transcriptional regulator CciR